MDIDPQIVQSAQRSTRLYAQCVDEIKFRLHHAERMLERLPQRDSVQNRVLVVEAVALQYRKTIELIALASIAANEELYARVRTEFQRDWNAKRIFRELDQLNPRFYPTPIAGLSDPQFEGGPSTIEEHETGFLTRDEATSLYDRCGGVLHADGPYRGKTDYASVLVNFRQRLGEFKVLLENFWVHLVPEDKAYCVWTYFGQDRSIDIALFQIGGRNT